MAATDNVQKGLKRADAELAVEALMRLPPAERGPFVEQVGALFRGAVAKAQQQKDWSRLSYWASRAERQPELAGPEGTPAHLAMCWALTWGSLKTKESPRARRWYGTLHQHLVGRVPGFAAAMAALVDGQPTAEVLTPFVTQPSADPRLGYDSPRPRAEQVAPSRPEEAEASVLALVAGEPWGIFAATVVGWAPKLEAATRRAVADLAGALAVREALRRLVAKEPHPLLPAELLRQLVEAEGAPPSFG